MKVYDTFETGKTGQQNVTVVAASVDHFELSMSTDIIAGNSYSVYVKAVDVYGNLANYSGTIEFETNNPDATLPAASDITNEGTFSPVIMRRSTYPVTAIYTLTAKEVGDGVPNGTLTGIKVNPAPATQFYVSNIPDPITAGSAANVIVEARDTYGNRDVNYISTITFTTDNPNYDFLISTYNFLPTDEGRKVFGSQVVLYKASPPDYKVGVYDIWISTHEGYQTDITVEPAGLDHFDISGVLDPETAGAVSNNVVVRAVDPYGNTYTLYNGTVSFSSSDIYASLPSDYQFSTTEQGVHTFSITMNTPGEHWVKVFDKNDTNKYGYQYDITVVTAPVSDVVTPSDSSYINSLSQITGTGFAYSPASLSKIEIYIKALDGAQAGNYWNKTDGLWQSTTYWNLVNGTTSWSFAVTWNWSDVIDSNGGGKLVIESKATDDLNGVEASTVPVQFVYDNKEPNSGITGPAYGGNYNKVNSITGTSSDPGNWSGISRIEIRILDKDTTSYWDAINSTWTHTPTWILVASWEPSQTFASPVNWNYDSSGVNWIDQHKYKVEARAKDGAGNWEITYPYTEFTYDITAPQSGVDSPINTGNYNKIEYITGTAYDAQGIDKVYVAISKVLPAPVAYWNWNSWDWSATGWDDPNAWKEVEYTNMDKTGWQIYTDTVTWANGYKYEARSKAIDKAGVEETPSSGPQFTFDTDDPDSYFDEPSYSYYNQAPLISGTASDNSPGKVSKVYIKIRRSDNFYWHENGWVLGEEFWNLANGTTNWSCLLYTSPSPRDRTRSRMPSSA